MSLFHKHTTASIRSPARAQDAASPAFADLACHRSTGRRSGPSARCLTRSASPDELVAGFPRLPCIFDQSAARGSPDPAPACSACLPTGDKRFVSARSQPTGGWVLMRPCAATLFAPGNGGPLSKRPQLAGHNRIAFLHPQRGLIRGLPPMPVIGAASLRTLRWLKPAGGPNGFGWNSPAWAGPPAQAGRWLAQLP